MAKSLGLIHTTKWNYEVPSSGTGEDNAFLCDASAELSTQFNRNIRMMQTYKLVGADIVVNVPENSPVLSGDRMIVKGRMRYMQPTKGRCEAMRTAYQQFRETARQQGVDLSKNKLFDFRVIPRSLVNYTANVVGVPANPILNTTTMNGQTELTMLGPDATAVFPSYNNGVAPIDQIVTSADFASGLQTQASAEGGYTQNDFVLNEGTIQSGNSNIADIGFEDIPFELAYDTTARRVTQLNWRPDPALYVSVLGGFVEIVLDEITVGGATGSPPVPGVEIELALHWAGWKSITRPPRSRKFPNRTQKNIAKQVGGVLTGKEAKALVKMLKKLM
jgi:hypothetical protein